MFFELIQKVRILFPESFAIIFVYLEFDIKRSNSVRKIFKFVYAFTYIVSYVWKSLVLTKNFFFYELIIIKIAVKIDPFFYLLPEITG